MSSAYGHDVTGPGGHGTSSRGSGTGPYRDGTPPRASGTRQDRDGTPPRTSGTRQEQHGTPPGLRRGRPDQGQAAVEFAGWAAVLILAALAAVQLGIVAYAVQQAGTASRAAARVASQGGNGESAGLGAMSGWLADGATVSAPPGPDDVTATVTVSIPAVLPLLSFDPVTRTTTMPVTTSEGGTP
ncbi:TadE/TadG family type IV pilus assembly protein [Streptomyces sp. TRM49041]|uniref:TadE/TadG family type IV pilus assembly protein n=1 Tax=Streptomyces sp. TRM49041 TaxID=2603216 RepID=UPI0011EBA84E|nr:TadE/TadG family type IV pilus assembly protein [Streptomyces sp. TRM49041]